MALARAPGTAPMLGFGSGRTTAIGIGVGAKDRTRCRGCPPVARNFRPDPGFGVYLEVAEACRDPPHRGQVQGLDAGNSRVVVENSLAVENLSKTLLQSAM